MSRPLARLLPALLVLVLLPGTAAAQAVDGPSPAPLDGSDRGPEAVDTGVLRDPAAPAAERFATPLPDAQPQGRGGQAAGACPLSFYPVDPADASLAIGVVPYHDIAPRLCAADRSDRVTLEVAGRSVQGRELPKVTITAPETPEQARRNDELEALLTDDPETAAALMASGGYAGYKPTLLANSNIHGNEWEGTDYALDLIDHLATATPTATIVENTDGLTPSQVAALPRVQDFLERFRVVLLPVANPDGRVLGQRENTPRIDMNRDHITQSQPEVIAMRDAIIDAQALVFTDHHGYVNGAGTSTFYTGYGLIEPATPPHGEGYEYDLYIKSALPLAEQAEADILRRRAAGDIDLMTRDIGVTIPFRDLDEGWDDWPPIFTPMYSIYHGAVGATIEFPWSPRGVADPAVRARNVRNNIEFGRATVDNMLVYGATNRDQLLADQLEVFRRGAAGAPSTYPTIPAGFVPGWGDEDRYPTEFPRAYVVPVGGGQASEVAAARLVQHLLDNDVEVGTLTTATTSGGRTYPAGSYVVDMHQAKRGLAHVMLHEGTDVTPRVDTMYDISGWSLSLLWGATVDDSADPLLPGRTTPVTAARPVGGVEPGDALGYALRLTTEGEIKALTALWRAGVPLQRASDGTVLVPASARDRLTALAAELDVPFRRVTELPVSRTELTSPRIAAAFGTGVLGTSSRYLLTQVLGFDVTAVTANQVRDGQVDLTQFDVLMASEGQLSWTGITPTGQARVRAFLAGGGGLVTYGRASALNLVGPSGLVPGLVATGSRTDANGVLAISTADSEVLPGRAGPGASFGYPLAWFSQPATGTAVLEQVLAADPLVSGHWRPGTNPATQPSQEAAAGQALTVSSALAGGGRLVAFGSEPLFRWHPKGLFDEVADAVLWSSGLPATTAGLGTPYLVPTEPVPPSATPTATASPTPSTSPTASPTAGPSVSPTPGCTARATLVLDRSTIVATGAAGAVVRAPAGATVEVLAYTRPSTAFRLVRSGVVGADGSLRLADLRPPANTRLVAQVRGCPADPVTDSIVLNVRTAMSLFASRTGPRSYRFTGDSLPARPGGLVVSLYRVTAQGRQVLTSQVRASATTGEWRIDRTFTGTGRFGFVVRTGQDLQNAPGASNVRPTLVF